MTGRKEGGRGERKKRKEVERGEEVKEEGEVEVRGAGKRR